jgi:hypothetical protein
MLGSRKLCDDIRILWRDGEARFRVPLARLVAAILALIGMEILLVLWMYELPARPGLFERPSGFLRLAEPSILLTHPKGPLCLLLVLVGVAIATVCRDLAELTRSRAEEAERRAVELQRTVSQAYVLAGFAAMMAVFLRWGA